MLNNLNITVISICLSFTSLLSHATGNNTSKDGLAISGYDAVSFFNSKPTRGDAEHSFKHDGVTYIFSSAVNQEVFAKNPQKYIPAYGGYCAYGVSLGKKFQIDPLAYEVNQKTLYLLLNGATKKVWEQNKEKNITAADNNWPIIENIAPTKLED